MISVSLFLRRTVEVICCVAVAFSGVPTIAISADIGAVERRVMYPLAIINGPQLTQFNLPRGRENLIQRTGPQRELLERIPPRAFIQDPLQQEALAAAQDILDRLTAEEQQKLRCRMARLGDERVELLLSTLQGMAATEEEIAAAKEFQSAMVRATCSGSGDVVAAVRGQAALFDTVARRFSVGTMLENRGAFLGQEMYLEALKGFEETCFGGAARTSYEELAKMSESDFVSSLSTIAFGNCGGSAAGRQTGVMPRNSSTAYGQCVSSAFHDFATKSLQECGIDRQDRPDDVDSEEGEEEARTADSGTGPTDPGQSRRADERDEATASAHSDSGRRMLIVGIGLFLGGALVLATGGAAAPAVVAYGAACMTVGGAFAVGGAHEHAEGERERNDALRAQGRLCPALDSPIGPLRFSVNVSQTGGGTQKMPMSVFDAIRSCACEHSANLNIPGQGNTCENAERMRCLSEANDDMPTPNLRCRAILKQDNQKLISAKYQECSVINCGPAAMIGEDCNCHQEAANTRPGAGIGADGGRCQIQCMPGYRPSGVGSACGCVPEGERPGGQNPGRGTISGPDININPGPIDRGGRFGLPGGRIRTPTEINRPDSNTRPVRPPD